MNRLTISSKSIAGIALTQRDATWAERGTLYEGRPDEPANARLWIRDAATRRLVQVDLPREGLLELQAIVGALLDVQVLGEKALAPPTPEGEDREPLRVP